MHSHHVGHGHCEWPTHTDNSQVHFCNSRDVKHPFSYCETHMALAYENYDSSLFTLTEFCENSKRDIEQEIKMRMSEHQYYHYTDVSDIANYFYPGIQ